MNDLSNVYILSPHIDDAAFSLTLTISKLVENNVSVTIINCFTITKWTAVPVENKGINAVSQLRKEEDAAFYKALNGNITIINLDLPDAPLRNGYVIQNQPFKQNELELVNELKNLLEKQVNGILLCPLTIGNHIDHAICREAVISLYKKRMVIFFEDLPYARRISEDQIQSHVKVLEEKLAVKLKSYIEGSENTLTDKGKAILVYKSQLNDEIVSEIVAHKNALHGERLWGEAGNIKVLINALEDKTIQFIA